MKRHLLTILGGGVITCLIAYFGFDVSTLPTEVGKSNETAVDTSSRIRRTTQSTFAAPADQRGTGSESGFHNGPDTNPGQPVGQSVGSQRKQTPVSGHVVVGTFNIQVFGRKKLANQNVINVIARIARYFDVLAIQELRSVDQTVIPKFVDMINADGSRYSYRVGKRQGRSSSKEQYVFIWNSETIELIQESWYVPDQNDRIHREPMICTFRCRGAYPRQAFSFSLMNIHTDPDEADEELDALADAFRYVQAVQSRQRFPEDDVLVLGDFNRPPRKYGRLGAIEQMFAAIPSHVPTNAAGTKNYDNIVFQRTRTAEFTGQAGVFDLTGRPFFLPAAAARKVSDHFPVWAIFSIYESAESEFQ